MCFPKYVSFSFLGLPIILQCFYQYNLGPLRQHSLPPTKISATTTWSQYLESDTGKPIRELQNGLF